MLIILKQRQTWCTERNSRRKRRSRKRFRKVKKSCLFFILWAMKERWGWELPWVCFFINKIKKLCSYCLKSKEFWDVGDAWTLSMWRQCDQSRPARWSLTPRRIQWLLFPGADQHLSSSHTRRFYSASIPTLQKHHQHHTLQGRASPNADVDAGLDSSRRCVGGLQCYMLSHKHALFKQLDTLTTQWNTSDLWTL